MYLALFLALILRLPLLNQSLWLDESIEALALMGRMGPLLKYALADFQPPVYHFVLYLWTRVAGFSEIALRFPSLLAGLWTVYFSYKLGELLKSKKVGIISSLLVATNPLLVYYSGEGRTYMMTAFFVTASFYYLFRLLKQNSNLLFVICYLLFTALAVWSSYLAWIVIALQFVYLIIKKRWDIARWTLLSALTLLFWMPSLIKSLGIGLSTASNSPEWGRVVGGISGKAIMLTWFKMVIGRISFANKYLYAAIVLVIGVVHTWVLRRLKIKKHSLLVLWLIGPIALSALVALLIPVYSYFRLLFVVPAYFILLALALAKNHSVLTYLTIFAQIIFVLIYIITPRFHHEDWRTLTAYLNTQSGTVAMPSRAQSAPLEYYGLDRPVIEPKKDMMTDSTVFYIKYAEDLFDVSQSGQANLRESGYTINKSYTYPGIQLDIYKLKNEN